ncbi:polyprenyl synthetase family protein, partial [candidate division WWE3 bacterium]|nr:polyprenyl synthetase family protein [candidate division WWE3 bacterium]
MQKIIDYLTQYKLDIDPVIEEVFSEIEEHAQTISPITLDAAKKYHAFMLGGKKHRGALTVFGHELVTGDYNKEILKASLAIEITHAFALIHDDVMDQDAVRRGKPTIHTQYEETYKNTYNNEINIHYAESMAYTLGDFGAYLGQLLLNKLDLPAERKSEAITHYVSKIMEVTYGQMLDVTIGMEDTPTEEDIRLIHRYKTGDYSGSLPMMIGAMLAGAQQEVLDAMYEYGWRIGTAYQFRDDEIGLFNETDEIGKPAGSDVRQNKNTILKVKAIQNANENDKNFLKKAYGNPNLTEDQLEKVRTITVDTGAFDYSRSICRKYIEESKEFIPHITNDK